MVVTGSTKGVGLALAEEFLRNGDSVVVCSRTKESVNKCVNDLGGIYGQDKVFGTTCDVSKADQVKHMAEFAKEKLGGEIDVWINNAGTNAYSFKTLMDIDAEKLEEIVSTNMLGLMFCMKEAMGVMRDQQRKGHIFNMDGAGASGSATPRFAAYGATKRSLEQFNMSLEAELEIHGIKNIVLHLLSPGMVTTELLMSGSDTPMSKFMINALAEEPKDVASFLVPRVREVVLEASEESSAGEGQGEGEGEGEGVSSFIAAANATRKKIMKKDSTYIKYLTLPKAFFQIFLKGAFGIRNNKWIEE